jgi:hypothetical protein
MDSNKFQAPENIVFVLGVYNEIEKLIVKLKMDIFCQQIRILKSIGCDSKSATTTKRRLV